MKITNRFPFRIFLLFYWILIVLTLVFIFTSFLDVGSEINNIANIAFILSLVLLAGISFFTFFIKPSFFEITFKKDHFVLAFLELEPHNLYNFNLNSAANKMKVFYSEFTGYKISYKKGGLQRFLQLYVDDKESRRKSKPINISFLSPKKYTDLIINLDKVSD